MKSVETWRISERSTSRLTPSSSFGETEKGTYLRETARRVSHACASSKVHQEVRALG